jgi:hypothetical protein
MTIKKALDQAVNSEGELSAKLQLRMFCRFCCLFPAKSANIGIVLVLNTVSSTASAVSPSARQQEKSQLRWSH